MLSVHGRGIRIELHTGQTSELVDWISSWGAGLPESRRVGCSITVPPEFLKVVVAGSAMPANISSSVAVGCFLDLKGLKEAVCRIPRIALSVASQPGCSLLVL